MSSENSVYCPDCKNMLKNKIEIQLVDEHNKPLTNMPYTLTNSKTTREGTTDGNGIIYEENLTILPLRLFIGGQELANEMETRPLRIKRNEKDNHASIKKNSTVYQECMKSHYKYSYVTIGELVDKLPVIQGWEANIPLPSYHFPDNTLKGISISPSSLVQRHVIEVCPFRAWSLLLHHQKDYSIVNAYNLALMSILAYGNGNIREIGSVEHFFNNQLLDLSRPPYKVNSEYFTPVVYDVPFSERYTEVLFTDSNQQEIPQGHTQFFYAANKEEIIIGWRGTEPEMQDAITDLTFQPIELGCTPRGVCSGFSDTGKVHRGFWEAFNLIGKLKVPMAEEESSMFDKITQLLGKRKLFISGHSLGGALALLHSAQLKAYAPCLYTYGMPRTFTHNAVQELSEIIHYRHVNENDTVPSVPFQKDMDNNAFRASLIGLGNYTEVANTPILREILTAYPLTSWTIPIVTNIKHKSNNNDPFLHHGKLVHFSIEYYEGLKLYLIPDLNEKNLKNTNEAIRQQEELEQLRKKEINTLFNGNENPRYKGGLGFPAHSSAKYASYINTRLLGFCSPETEEKDTNEQNNLSFLEKKLNLPAAARRHYLLMEMDGQLITTLDVTKKDNRGSVALQRYYTYRHSNAR